ncbi:MAG: excinuclease ABC subunit UvrA [Bacteroidetes bacterium]|nr:MAG: excinuclease ABC subunit UvrA [Bacteroidota bacterium]
MSKVREADQSYIEITGAREHNLKNIDLDIPRDQLVVITGLSGSGKSSLAFDTIYAEGQRRYLETLSAYARQFLGGLERPDVDQITGLSPVVSIDQKTISRNPRSTVGTITEVYDFMRLLFARIATAYSYNTGQKMVRFSSSQIISQILNKFNGKKVVLLAPVVKGRKGHYRELFKQILRQGFIRARVDGEIVELLEGFKVDRYVRHDIEIVIDRLKVADSFQARLKESVMLSLKTGKGVMMLLDVDDNKIHFFSKHLMCPKTGIAYDDPEPNLFSFNSPYGACPNCNGLGKISEIDIDKIIPNRTVSVKNGAIVPLGKYNSSRIFKQIESILIKESFSIEDPIAKMPEVLVHTLMNGTDEYVTVSSDIGLSDIAMPFEGVIEFLSRRYKEKPTASSQRWLKGITNKIECPDCHGFRLKKQAKFFKINDKNIGELSGLNITDLVHFFKELPGKLNEKQLVIGKEVFKEIDERLSFLVEVGLGYLQLSRSARTLSGGEAQRIRLATQIASQLVGVLYILDEPSIGLHQRDNDRLIKSLKRIKNAGNSVIVVEHDKDMIESADYVIDIGPGAGKHGGEIITAGLPENLKNENSLTAQYLHGVRKIDIPKKRRKGNGKILSLIGASGHNLKSIDVSFPLGKFICITGVSGSGKSSLINQTLYPIMNNHFYRGTRQILPYKSIRGLENLDKVIEIDQSPIGRTPRSNPSTYTGTFTEIRNIFAMTPESKIRGYKPGRFSFNIKGGRCESCRGAGLRVIEMNFLPDVYVHCETCQGKRYNRETLEVKFKGKTISDVLDMTIDEAVVFFKDIPSIFQKTKTMQDVGLGYITMGQQSTTLSGGEAQRVKLSTELSKRSTGLTFYILDEPTTGLHFEDIRHLLVVLNRLVEQGNTVLVIEHNMEIIKVADHIIDIGPEGGEEGGQIVASGTPEEIIMNKEGFTSKFLETELKS